MKRTTKIITVVSLATVVGCGFSFGTKWEVNRQIAPIETYFTAEEIASGTAITEEMLLPMEIPSKAIPPNAITDKSQIVGMYVKNGFNIPPNSYLYSEVLTPENEMPNSSVLKLKEGEYAFPLLVDLETSLGNGILPDSKVDLAFRATLDNDSGEDMVIFGTLATDVRVTSVKDSNATAVFKDEANSTKDKNSKAESMSKLYTFAVSGELNDLLSKAAKLGEIRPVAKGQTEETAKSETILSQNEVVDYILNNSYLAKENKNRQQLLSQKAKGNTVSIAKDNKGNQSSNNSNLKQKNNGILSDEEEALIRKYSNN